MYDFKIKDEPFAVGFLNSGSDSIYVSTGAGYLEASKHIGISFDPETGFPLFDLGRCAVFPSYSSGETPLLWMLEEKSTDCPENAADYKYIADKMKQYDVQARLREAFTENEADILWSRSGWGGTWGGHAVPDLADFARIGTNGIRDKVLCHKKKNPDKSDFYEGLLLTLDAIDALGSRIYELALSEYGKCGNQKLKKVISAFAKCPRFPAETFAEAVCVYVTVYSVDGTDSPGHFDQYMADFWAASDLEESREALEDLWLYFQKRERGTFVSRALTKRGTT